MDWLRLGILVFVLMFCAASWCGVAVLLGVYA
jgi:hypothetical protein